jgi:hypothetical protein
MTRRVILRSASALTGLIAVALLSAAEPLPTSERKFTPEQIAFFEKEVQPLLQQHCLKCHGGEKVRGNLRLTGREHVLKGGDLGPAFSADKPDESRLLQAINWKDGLEMPPKGKLPAADIETLTKWVKMGLPWSAGKTEVVKKEEPKGGVVTEESKNYWAYRPVKAREVPFQRERPANVSASWIRNPIDAYLLARMQTKGLSPNPAADRVTLIRRATYDLIGLPPTPEQVDAFVNDRSPDAYEKLIDKLLESPQYGEKWGRHWLDLVRFAETNGYERDGPKPYAWRYRDYVIKSFNQDKPFDQFVKEQLAGDEMPGNNPDAIIATGYYRLGLYDDEPADPLLARFDELDDIVTTTSQGLLGTTMNCVRCHAHKRDPIPHADYYRFLSFFVDVPRYDNNQDPRSATTISDVTSPEARAEYETELKKREIRKADLKMAMEQLENEVIKRMSAEDQRASEGAERPQVLRKLKGFFKDDEEKQYSAMKKERLALEKIPDPPNRQLALSVNHCPITPPETFILTRGLPRSPAAKVTPGFPTVLGAPDPQLPKLEKGARSSGRRTALANWITSKDNPLTARVFVNRLWQHHFGRGIVPTPNDFGLLGEPPTHPELLDWLAEDFVKGGWRVKRMHKLLMLSSAYQMSSKGDEKGLKVDPGNTLYWRFSMRRLSAEEVRDSFLAVSGKLNLKAGGPSVYPVIPRAVLAGQSVPGQGWGHSTPEEAARRSVYVYVKRSLLVPVLSQHDQADTDTSCPVRYTTTVPTQALGMLNGEFSNEQAVAFAERLRKESPGDVAAQVRRAIRLTTNRQPSDEEVNKDVAFVRNLQAKYGLTDGAAMRQYCLLALNTNEFIYLD